MVTTTQQGGSSPPPKPWERAGSSSGPTPFKPPSTGSTSDVVEASGTAKHGEIVSTSNRNTVVSTNSVGRPLPTRPCENPYGSTGYGGYSSDVSYNSGYGSGMYNSYGGGYGGIYGGTYGNNIYRGGYGGSLYGPGMYGGGMYNSGFGAPTTMGGYGIGMGGPVGHQDPNNPPPSPPGFWISFLRVTIWGASFASTVELNFQLKSFASSKMEGVVTFFGRISFLVDQNTQAIHLFMSALLQLFDRGGVLYGELARFVLRILEVRQRLRKIAPPCPNRPNSQAD